MAKQHSPQTHALLGEHVATIDGIVDSIPGATISRVTQAIVGAALSGDVASVELFAKSARRVSRPVSVTDSLPPEFRSALATLTEAITRIENDTTCDARDVASEAMSATAATVLDVGVPKPFVDAFNTLFDALDEIYERARLADESSTTWSDAAAAASTAIEASQRILHDNKPNAGAHR